MLTQGYTKVPITVRDQLAQLFVWYPKNRGNFDLINTENDVIDTKDLPEIKKKLKKEHDCLYMRVREPREYNYYQITIK